MDERVKKRVHEYYWEQDLNCATTALRILSEVFNVPVQDQVYDSAVGMHGAGGYRAQCGIVEGSLMFAGILGRHHGAENEAIAALCQDLARTFEEKFSSLICRTLRPQGFAPDLPPHLCEGLTVSGIRLTINLMKTWLDNQSPSTPITEV